MPLQPGHDVLVTLQQRGGLAAERRARQRLDAALVHPEVTKQLRVRPLGRPASGEREVRSAVVLDGGVSLTVWMGGVILELDQAH